MRLSADEIAAIRDCAAIHFGKDAVVRLFGSRLRDDLSGGDIDLHVTANRDADRHGSGFLESLSERIGDQSIDLLLIDPFERLRPIDQIAILSGRVLMGPAGQPFEPAAGSPGQDGIQMTRAQLDLIADALVGGRNAKGRLEELLVDLEGRLPLDAETIGHLSRLELLQTDSLLLQFGNLVAIVQDQLLRGFLLLHDGEIGTRDRSRQRKRAEALGIIPVGLDLPRIAAARNGVAHQYPADPAKQAAIINAVAGAVPSAIEAFDALANHAGTLKPSVEGGREDG